jgi:hypothetical protein
MMTRTLYRRLERLEEQTMPMDEPKVWQIVVLDSDGTQTLGDRIEWSARGHLGTKSRPWQRLGSLG